MSILYEPNGMIKKLSQCVQSALLMDARLDSLEVLRHGRPQVGKAGYIYVVKTYQTTL